MDTVLSKINYPKNINDIKKNARTFNYFTKRWPEFVYFLKNKYGDISFSEMIYLFYNNLDQPPVCTNCGNPVKFRNFSYGYNDCCSKECAYNLPSRVEKCKQTKLERYGDSNYNNHEKCKQTCLEKYGVTNAFAAESVKETIKTTLINKYGVEYAQQSSKIQEVRKQNSLNKYGVDHHMKVDDIKIKLSKIQQSKKISNIDFLIGYTDDGDWICKCPHHGCNKCIDKQYIIPSQNYFARKKFNIEPCTKLKEIKFDHSAGTTLEIFVRNILDKYKIEYRNNNRTILNGKELDIYIPSKNIAIECNGVFWHSTKHHKPQNFHINKYVGCLEHGIQLITIWEDQIKNKPNIVESIILSKLGIYKNRVGARKCIIKEIDSRTCTNFLENNHIQGRTNANVKLGLFYNEELVGVMTFSKRSKVSGSNKLIDDEWELSRFCTKLGLQVIGAADKLMKYFIKKYNPSIITSFASNDISNGDLYKKLGFVQDDKITSAYWYIHNTNYIRYHRTSFSKSRLKKLGYNVEGKTENEIMLELPYYKIYDSGHTKYTLTI